LGINGWIPVAERGGLQIETHPSGFGGEEEDERGVATAIESVDKSQSLLAQDCAVETESGPGPLPRQRLDGIQHGGEVGDHDLSQLEDQREDGGRLTIFP
jgi:hypothetical protein